MTHTRKNKLMNLRYPADDLQELQREIIEVIQGYDYKNFGNTNGCPFYHLLNLLAGTLPTYHQQKQMIEFTEMANDPAISETAIIGWFKSRKEYLSKEPENQ